ncbi:tRNA (adenosine(37)-N6)-threonylcarbamoyltransferase complex dimerization subunit type 1 TsaB [Thermodesulfobacteriota bacterium]
MLILALDTTSMNLSCAITKDGKCLAEFSLFTEATHSERLLSLISDTLRATNLDIADMDYYACSVGPGSFTGLRIGLSTIKGLAYANNKRIAAVSSLDALSENVQFSDYDICPMIDARKGEVFTAFYKRKKGGLPFYQSIKSKTDEINVTPDTLFNMVKRKTIFLGNGALLYKDALKSKLEDKVILMPYEMNFIKAFNVAKIGLSKIENGETISPDELLPVYIRESDAEINYKKRTAKK